MKRVIAVVILIAAGFAGGVLWMQHRQAPASPPAAEAAAPTDEEAAGPHLSRDTNGNAVISMTAEVQRDLGIVVKSPAAFQMSPELKGYGKVLDPAALAVMVAELSAARAAYTASSTELARLKTLQGEGNASVRALQTAQVAAQRDLLAVQSATQRLSLSWGKAVAAQTNLAAFARSLVSLEAAVVRIDLPLGETTNAAPMGARIATLSGQMADAAFLDPAPSVDPQMQGRGFFFLLKPNSLRLTAGESVVGYIKFPGEPLPGVIIPRDAVVRTEGAGWVYVMNSASDAFTRIEVALDHPTEAGWFVTKGVAAGQYVVMTGAQQLLSFETKGAGGGE